MAGFRVAHRAGSTWQEMAAAALRELGPRRPEENIGFLYATDYLAPHLGEILAELRASTGIAEWIGTTGIGIGARGEAGEAVEYYDRPAIALMLGALPAGSFRVFEPVHGGLGPFRSENGAWLARAQPLVGIVHGDPRNPLTPEIVRGLAEATGSFLVGGLTSSRAGGFPQIADGVVEGGVSGALFAAGVGVATGLSQGCSPIGPAHEITEAEQNIVKALDGRSAFAVLAEEIGEVLSRQLHRVAGYIHVALPVEGSDIADYLVRNLVGIDREKGWLAIGELVEPGRRLLFVRRDRDAAERDLKRMLESVTRRAGASIKGGVYFACVARGANLFGANSEELALVADALGSAPLVSFLANGEICRDRLYGYTGVLTLFL
jgi:small ligand-binding sensory domain FIST